MAASVGGLRLTQDRVAAFVLNDRPIRHDYWLCQSSCLFDLSAPHEFDIR
jgi:hypothetical protein